MEQVLITCLVLEILVLLRKMPWKWNYHISDGLLLKLSFFGLFIIIASRWGVRLAWYQSEWRDVSSYWFWWSAFFTKVIIHKYFSYKSSQAQVEIQMSELLIISNELPRIFLAHNLNSVRNLNFWMLREWTNAEKTPSIRLIWLQVQPFIDNFCRALIAFSYFRHFEFEIYFPFIFPWRR